MRPHLNHVLLRALFLVLPMLATAGPTTAREIADPLGLAIPEARGVDREIRIEPDTRWVNVTRNESVRFVVTATGRSFGWHFYTLGHPVFDLKLVAPDALGTQSVKAYVDLDASEY